MPRHRASRREVEETCACARELRASEARYRALFDASPIPTYVVDRDTRAFIDVNAAAIREYGYSRDEFLAMSLAELRPAEEAPRLVDAIARTSGERQDFGIWIHRRKDGSRLEAEVSAQVVDLDGRAVILASARDVTEERRLQRSIAESEQRHRTLFEGAALAMWIWEPGTLRLVDANEAASRLYGYSRDELLAMTLADVLPPEDADVVALLRSRAPHPFSGERVHVRKDGSRVRVQVDTTPVILDGRTVAFTIVQDVTARERLQRELVQAQKMEAIGRLAGGVAHDFNNLLSVILANVDWLAQSLAGDDELLQDVVDIGTSAQRAAALTRQLLLFSRREPAQPTHVDLNAVVADVERLLRRVIGEDVQVTCDLDPALGSVEADPTQIHQVLLNLAVNARDAMPKGGTLVVRTANVDLGGGREACAVSVTDSGCGMDEATRAHLFEPFFTTKEPGRGTGLGLSTAFGIVEQCGGRITVESAPGKGSTFTIVLPRARRPSRQSGTHPIPPAREAHGKILVVEDDDEVRRIVGRTLRSSGYDVIEAREADEAMRIATGSPAPLDLVVTDVVMPGGDGIDLGERLRAARPGLPVLFMSGYAERLAETAIRSRVLRKPFTPEQLCAAVNEAMAG